MVCVGAFGREGVADDDDDAGGQAGRTHRSGRAQHIIIKIGLRRELQPTQSEKSPSRRNQACPDRGAGGGCGGIYLKRVAAAPRSRRRIGPGTEMRNWGGPLPRRSHAVPPLTLLIRRAFPVAPEDSTPRCGW